MPDKINFHKQSSDIVYIGLLQFTLENSKLGSRVSKLEGQLKQEKTTNKAWKAQIKRLGIDVLVVGEDLKNIQAIKKLLDEKENTIEVLKEKLKIPRAQHVQTLELTSLKQERETLQQEQINYKEKVLTLENENQEWKREKQEFLLEQIPVSPSQKKEVSTEELSKAMSQISLKYGEIKTLT